MKRTASFLMASVFSLSTVSYARAEVLLATPNASYGGYGFSSSDDDTAEIKIFAGIEEARGRVAVCGLVIVETTDNSFMRGEPQMTRQVVFTLNGKRLAVQTANFKRYASEKEAVQGNAGCYVTKEPWQPGFAKAKLNLGMGKRTASFTDQF